MKFLGSLLLLGVGSAIVGPSLQPPSVHAMDQASSNLTRTENNLKSAVSTTVRRAQVVEQRADGNRTALPAALQDFTLSTQRLASLRENLAHDITAYEEARAKKMDEFTKELGDIKDEGTRRAMENLRRHAEEQAAERLALARAALTGLDDTLAQGADLQHAARCVMLADEFNTQGEDLDATVRQAKTQASSYAAVTSDLLARITRALTT